MVSSCASAHHIILSQSSFFWMLPITLNPKLEAPDLGPSREATMGVFTNLKLHLYRIMALT